MSSERVNESKLDRSCGVRPDSRPYVVFDAGEVALLVVVEADEAQVEGVLRQAHDSADHDVAFLDQLERRSLTRTSQLKQEIIKSLLQSSGVCAVPVRCP